MESINYGYGIGAGYGGGESDCSGFGRGSGNGYGGGCSCGYGSGYGSSDYSCHGIGYGGGIGGITKYCGDDVLYIDGISTIIDRKYTQHCFKGRILNPDLTTSKCWVLSDDNGNFAHGDTLKDAQQALIQKIIQSINVDERIERFKELFKAEETYPTRSFYEWHNLLTGSCEMGRKTFAQDHEIDLNGSMTVKEFINLTKNAYGGEIIRKLEEYYD